MSKRLLIFGVVISLSALGCGSSDNEAASEAPERTAYGSCDIENPPLYAADTLTVATDSSTSPPWLEGSPENYTGYEGDLTNAIANRLGLPVTWVVEPFEASYTAGGKDRDFAVGQIAITEEREESATFSDGYLDNSQGVLALEGSPVANARTLSDLANAKLGARANSTSLDLINKNIEPRQKASSFNTTENAAAALQNNRIDALVTDLATAAYLQNSAVEGSVLVGRYPSGEQFGLAFEKNNELVGCINRILDELKADGTLENLQNEYLGRYLQAPELKD